MSGYKRLSKTLAENSGNVFFECPACGVPHGVNCGKGYGPMWSWDGNIDKPTFSPSVLVIAQYYEPPATEENIQKIRSGEIKQAKVEYRCHSFVRAGRIQFLNDCTHELAGKTVDIPEWDTECTKEDE